MDAVCALGLRKCFGEKVAVDGIDLRVRRGSWFGVVGPNGAGKTTSLRMITGLLKPDAGSIIVDGIDVWADPVTAKTRYGVLPDDLRLIERLTGREFLTYLGRLRSLSAGECGRRVDELLEVLGLTASARELVADYSQGMRKKVGLGAALLHVPSVLFLDEPFESVDPVSARTIQEVLGHYRRSGGTVVFSSHVMDVVERLSDEVAIVHQGHVVASGAVEDLCRTSRLEEVFMNAVGATDKAAPELAWLRAPVQPAAA